MDNNVTLEALALATDRLNWYIGLTVLSIFVSTIALIVSFKSGKKQLHANHEWNRRQLALTEVVKNREHASQAIVALNDSLNYREQKDAYSLKEIHKALCNEEDHTKNPPLTDSGKTIKHNIFIILNYYEYLAIGINRQIFDEETIKISVKGAMIKANKLFGEYIQHLRSEKHTSNKNLFINLETISEKWKNENASKPEEATPTA